MSQVFCESNKTTIVQAITEKIAKQEIAFVWQLALTAFN